LITEKVAAYLSEGSFWGPDPITKTEMKLVVFIANADARAGGFDVLAIVPELNLTLEMRKCEEEPAIFVQGWGASKEAMKEPDEYLRNQISNLSNFVAHARKYATLAPITSDPAKLFDAEPALRTKRIEQIKSVLGELMPQQPLEIRVAYFSRLTELIAVLVPSLGRRYAMGVVRESCGKESVVESKVYRLKSTRPDLLGKIEKFSTVEVIR
jgi:hypothetical protein